MSKNQRISRIDQFLGINEADDSTTELKIGEASKMINWQITDGANIATRPGFGRAGIRNIDVEGIETAMITGMWSGHLLQEQYLVIVFGGMEGENTSAIAVYRIEEGDAFTCVASKAISTPTIGWPNKIFYFGGRLYAFLGNTEIVCIQLEENTGVISITTELHLYEPVVLTGTAPTGGGTTLEPLNLLSPNFRVNFSGDGTAKEYILPATTTAVTKVVIDNQEHTPESLGSFSAETHTFTFTQAPIEGINNVEVYCSYDSQEFHQQLEKFYRMPFCEAFNGSTDNRLFFYGDGTNTTYYTGVPVYGDGLYLPAMNEISIGFSDASITGMARDYTKLLVFTKDGTANITYSPITLEDGSVIAGFYVRTTSKEIGNEAPGQVQIVGNYPRTLFRGDLYEWRVSSSGYQDERYSRRISDRIRRTLGSADLSRVVTCDDNLANTYYMFINDAEGTILVNNYSLDLWTVYRSRLAVDVRWAMICDGRFLFATQNDVFYLTGTGVYDAPLLAGGEIKLSRKRLTRALQSGELPTFDASGIDRRVEETLSGLETAVRECFAAALDRPAADIPPNAHFFNELGGTSLEYFALQGEIKARLGLEITFTEGNTLFTVRDFTSYIQKQ